MKVKLEYIAVFNFLVFIFSFSLFCYGFFPLSFSPSTKSSLDELPNSVENASLDTTNYKPRISRAVFMLIDALRMDFIDQEDNFKFLNKLVKDRRACLYRLQVHPPTVTMPRIKAMTSGAIPSFLDVILNLGSPEMKLDTFLYQMKQRQQKIVFYGDDTWTNMFPDTFHRQGENVDSLYVNDFYEGDRNITRFLNLELQMYDWKLMVLHYLGLDHIGHVEGPFSEKVPAKLQEMDKIIEIIYETMHKWEKKYYTKPLLIITGDHGMRDSGGHGGSTHPETIVPLVIVSDQCAKSNETFLQIDLAPTMSVLTGVAIPHASIGSVIEPVLQGLESREKLYVLYYNTRRLISKAEAVVPDRFHITDMYVNYEEAKRLHGLFINDTTDIASYKRAVLLYSSASSKLTQLLITSYIRYDLVFIVIGAAMSISCTVMAVFLFLQNTATQAIALRPKLFPFVCYFIIILMILKILSFERQPVASTYMFDASLVVLAFFFLSIWWFTLLLYEGIKLKRLNLQNHPPSTSILVWFGVIFHCVSLASSSFIEEEHQTWYYFTCSIMLLLTLKQLQIMNHTIGMIKHPKTDAALISVCQEERNLFCITSVASFAIHILIRRFNQTGDKWQHIPDVGDWLTKEDHKVWLSLSIFVGLCYLVYQICCIGGLLTNVLSLTAAMLIYYYRTVTGVVSFLGLAPANSSVCLTIFWINLLEIFFIGFLPKLYRFLMGNNNSKRSSELYDNCLIVVALLSALLHKPHNVLLVGVLMASSRFLTQRIDRVAESADSNVVLKVITHYWLGKAFYFYQGNSNSLATIDLNAGYVGLNHFDILRVGIFLTLHTFSGPILSFLVLMHNLLVAKQSEIGHILPTETRSLACRSRMLSLINTLTMLPVSFFIIVATLLRDHIFVWTVFSPKIIYEYFNVWLVLVQIFLVMCLFKTSNGI